MNTPAQSTGATQVATTWSGCRSSLAPLIKRGLGGILLLLILLAGCQPPKPSSAPPTSTPAAPPTPVATATAISTSTPWIFTRIPTHTPEPPAAATGAMASRTAYPPPATPSATSVSSDTPFPTATSTVAPTTTATAAVEAAPRTAGLVPILYEMQDYENTDWRLARPDWGPLGSWMWWPWARLNPEPGRYNWELIDSYLTTAAAQQVELASGELIPKPVALSVQIYPDKGADGTPGWVYDRYIPAAPRLGDARVGWLVDPDGEGACAPTGVPRWGDATWERLYDEFVLALGQRYDADPRVNSVWIATGLYGETIEEKTYDGCRYVFGHGGDFAQWVLHAMETYRRAFPTKPLFIINSGGWGTRKDTAALAATMDPPMGIKLNVLAPDLNDSYGYNSLAGGGKFEIVNQYSETLPIAFEHAFPARPADAYWSIMNALAHRADLLDFDAPEMFEVIRGLDPIFPLWDFIDAHLGRDAQTTPDVWILLRDTYHTKAKYQGWSSGEYGDWDFYLTRPEGIPGNATVALTETIASALPAPAARHIYGYHSARRTDQASGNRYMSFDVDDRYPYAGQAPIAAGGSVGYTVEAVLLNRGEDEVALEYLNARGEWVSQVARKGAALGPVDDWVTVRWTLPDAHFANQLPGGTDFRLDSRGDGDEVVHRIIVTGFRAGS